MNLTDAQLQAVAAKGNTLVLAGAGTGKTRTMVSRCLDRLFRDNPPGSLDRVLMVTFTEAAADQASRATAARLTAQKCFLRRAFMIDLPRIARSVPGSQKYQN